jgi:hypothetical protein
MESVVYQRSYEELMAEFPQNRDWHRIFRSRLFHDGGATGPFGLPTKVDLHVRRITRRTACNSRIFGNPALPGDFRGTSARAAIAHGSFPQGCTPFSQIESL